MKLMLKKELMSLSSLVCKFYYIYTKAKVVPFGATFAFYYGKDAYIMSYIFGYQLKLIENNIYVCAFLKT